MAVADREWKIEIDSSDMEAYLTKEYDRISVERRHDVDVSFPTLSVRIDGRHVTTSHVYPLDDYVALVCVEPTLAGFRIGKVLCFILTRYNGAWVLGSKISSVPAEEMPGSNPPRQLIDLFIRVAGNI